MADRLYCIMEGLGQTTELVENAIKNMDKDVEDIKNYLYELDAMWEGPAHDTYRTDFLNDLNNFSEVLNRYKKLLIFKKTASEEYSKANQTSEDLVNSVG